MKIVECVTSYNRAAVVAVVKQVARMVVTGAAACHAPYQTLPTSMFVPHLS